MKRSSVRVLRYAWVLLIAAVLLGATQARAVVINEIMQNPAAVSDSAGEWFEVYNPTGTDIDLNGWTIQDADYDSHVIDNGGPLLLPPGSYLVLGNNGDFSTNGGVVVDYVYTGLFLSNSADELLAIHAGGGEVDRVEWDGGPSFPDPTGASMALRDPFLDNNAGGNWCTSSTPYGAGDLGTPGGPNDCAPAELVINEIMQNPAAVYDSNGEWFELYNPTAIDVNINGWVIQDNGSDSHTINNGGPLVVPAGGYLVLGNNSDFATNGGVTVDYMYSGFFLANGADELLALMSGGLEIDRVEWDGGPFFPDPNGASMALRDPALDNNLGANWCESSTPFGDGDLGTPGGPNDCAPPELVINEIMQNPAAVYDSAGEWFELYNPGTADVNINGWVIRDNDTNVHTINNGGALLVPGGGYLVLGRNGDLVTNGGVFVDYVYSGMDLGNGADELLALHNGITEVDRVEWDGGPTFPDPNGASMALSNPSLDNNDGTNWCESSTPFGDGDFGTPGGPNDCDVPGLVINEIMQNPAAVSDAAGEWFELYNPGSTDVNIDGWMIQDNDFDTHVISNGGPLVVPAGGYLVLGNNADFATNGGVNVDYQYSSMFLSNAADELVALLMGSIEVDRVEWDGGITFPDPTGASMALSDPALDNNVGASWCESFTPFGAGDLGTPGGPNDCPVDQDGDGFNDREDCNDLNPSIYPGAPETLCDGVDQNCNGMADDDQNLDGDPVSLCNGDCDDTNPAIYPGAEEVCNGIDDDCDGDVDEGWDADGDGIADCFDDCPFDPDNDIDEDEICGDVDNCPDVYNPDQTDFNGDGVGDACTACEPDPASQGYWHRQCLGVPAAEGGIDPGRNGRGPSEPLEPDFVKSLMDPVSVLLADTVFEYRSCADGMDAFPARDACEKAVKQTTAMLFNLASGRLSGSCGIDLVDEGCSSTNLTDLVDELAALINTGDADNCKVAKSCAAAVNEGYVIPEATPLTVEDLLSQPDVTVPVSEDVAVVEPTRTSGGAVSRQPEVVDTLDAATVALPTALVAPLLEPVVTEVEVVVEESPAVTVDDGKSLERHLAVLSSAAAPDRALEVSRDALLTALSGGYEPELRLEIVTRLLERIDVAYHGLLIGHLEDIRAEAEAFEMGDLAGQAVRLLERLEAGE